MDLKSMAEAFAKECRLTEDRYVKAGLEGVEVYFVEERPRRRVQRAMRLVMTIDDLLHIEKDPIARAALIVKLRRGWKAMLAGEVMP